MAGFTTSSMEKKLAELSGSRQSIETLSFWLIHHKKHCKTIVQLWLRELKKAVPYRMLAFMNLANDVIQTSKKKGPEFNQEFGTILGEALHYVYSSGAVADAQIKYGLDRIIQVWEDRRVYHKNHIEIFRNAMKGKNSSSQTKNAEKVSSSHQEKQIGFGKRRNSDSGMEPLTKKMKTTAAGDSENHKSHSRSSSKAGVFIKLMQNLENCPSMDAETRERLAQLPPEVIDISLWTNIQDSESAEKLSKQLAEACSSVSAYNTRISAEMRDRNLLSKMIGDYLQAQRQQLDQTVKNLEEHKDHLKRIVQLRNELKSQEQNLPDLALMQTVIGGLEPLPSADDLFDEI